MNTLFKRARIAVFGPKKVDNIVKSFHKAIADLKETADHHNEVARQHKIEVVRNETASAHAARVHAKLQSIID